jgi:hypothetical protein
LRKTAIGLAAVAALTGCVQSTGGSQAGIPMRTPGKPASSPAYARWRGPAAPNNRIVGHELGDLRGHPVGDQRAPWRCLVKNGQMREVIFAGNEGTP